MSDTNNMMEQLMGSIYNLYRPLSIRKDPNLRLCEGEIKVYNNGSICFFPDRNSAERLHSSPNYYGPSGVKTTPGAEKYKRLVNTAYSEVNRLLQEELANPPQCPVDENFVDDTNGKSNLIINMPLYLDDENGNSHKYIFQVSSDHGKRLQHYVHGLGEALEKDGISPEEEERITPALGQWLDKHIQEYNRYIEIYEDRDASNS